VRLRLVLAAALAAVVVPLVAFGASTTKLAATMSGGVEVPKGAPAGHATASVTISGTKVCWKYTNVTGIDKPTASHIHKGKPGTAGPVVVPFGAAYKAAGCTTTTAALAKAIAANPKAYYVNIHTAKYPPGAVRGQLKVASSSTY
jgi:hypothetical protein